MFLMDESRNEPYYIKNIIKKQQMEEIKNGN